jgi:hypothetical protein
MHGANIAPAFRMAIAHGVAKNVTASGGEYQRSCGKPCALCRNIILQNQATLRYIAPNDPSAMPSV